MIRFFCFLWVLIGSTSIFCQKVQLGVMGGINTTVDNIKTTVDNIKTTSMMSASESKLGYNFVGFGRISVLGFFVQPEIGYFNNRVGLTYNTTTPNVDATLSLGQLYNSLMVGYKIGTLRVQAGPLFFREINPSLENSSKLDISMQSIQNNENKWGVQAGLGLNIAKHWMIDARFMQRFQTSNYSTTIQSATEILHGKLSNVTIFFGYTLFKN